MKSIKKRDVAAGAVGAALGAAAGGAAGYKKGGIDTEDKAVKNYTKYVDKQIEDFKNNDTLYKIAKHSIPNIDEKVDDAKQEALKRFHKLFDETATLSRGLNMWNFISEASVKQPKPSTIKSMTAGSQKGEVPTDKVSKKQIVKLTEAESIFYEQVLVESIIDTAYFYENEDFELALEVYVNQVQNDEVDETLEEALSTLIEPYFESNMPLFEAVDINDRKLAKGIRQKRALMQKAKATRESIESRKAPKENLLKKLRGKMTKDNFVKTLFKAQQKLKAAPHNLKMFAKATGEKASEMAKAAPEKVKEAAGAASKMAKSAKTELGRTAKSKARRALAMKRRYSNIAKRNFGTMKAAVASKLLRKNKPLAIEYKPVTA